MIEGAAAIEKGIEESSSTKTTDKKESLVNDLRHNEIYGFSL
jgi:hypothetical protein